MLKEKLSERETNSHEPLYNKNWLTWWSLRGNAWNSQIEKEYLIDSDRTLEKPNITTAARKGGNALPPHTSLTHAEFPPGDPRRLTVGSNKILIGILATLLLLAAAALSHTPKANQTLEEARINSAKSIPKNY